MDRKFVINQVDIVSGEVAFAPSNLERLQGGRAFVEQGNSNPEMLSDEFFAVAEKLHFDRPKSGIRYEEFHLDNNAPLEGE